MSKPTPLSIPELGLAYLVETTVEQGNAAQGEANALEQDDTVKQIRFRNQEKETSKSEWGKWANLERDQWVWAFARLQEAENHTVSLKVEGTKKPAPGGARKAGDAEVREIEIEAQPDVTWPLADRGFVLKPESRVLKADHLWEAVMLGLKDTHDQIVDVFYNISGMFSGRISVDNVGGPLTIAYVAFRFAQLNFWEFLFFLGAISVNLAVINFFPIPVLDGGYMVFLTYEKLRGRPASEQVRVRRSQVTPRLGANRNTCSPYFRTARLAVPNPKLDRSRTGTDCGNIALRNRAGLRRADQRSRCSRSGCAHDRGSSLRRLARQCRRGPRGDERRLGRLFQHGA